MVIVGGGGCLLSHVLSLSLSSEDGWVVLFVVCFVAVVFLQLMNGGLTAG